MIILKYWNPQYEIAFADWQNVYQFTQKIKMLRTNTVPILEVLDKL